jgi:LuxR family maltose regulon positive regulatory protein
MHEVKSFRVSRQGNSNLLRLSVAAITGKGVVPVLGNSTCLHREIAMTNVSSIEQGQLPHQHPFPIVDTQLFLRLKATLEERKFTLLEAPLGYGKTTLLNKLHGHTLAQGIDALWVPLREDDDSLDALARLVKSANGRSIASKARSQRRSGRSDRNATRGILSYLDQRKKPLRVFIDNLGICRDPRLGKLIDGLLWDTPEQIQFFAATSRRLEFDVVRSATEGKLLCLGTEELKFNSEDVAEFLKLWKALESQNEDCILRKTEGWPIAISLLCRIAADASNPDAAIEEFSGEDEELSMLLRHELLRSLDEDYLRFLLETAHLRELSPDLCRYVTGEGKSTRYLTRLLDECCFVLPLDRSGHKLVMHPLVREFLGKEAKTRIDPERRERLLARASEWSKRKGDIQNAVTYALASSSADLIARTLHEIAPAAVGQKGELKQYIEWVERAKGEGISLSMECDYWYIWALLFSRQPESAYVHSNLLWERYINDEILKSSPESATAFLRRFEELRILVDVFREDLTEAGMEGQRWLESPSSANSISIATVSCAVAIHATVNFDFKTARNAIQTAYSGINATISDYGQAWVAALSAQIDYYEGEYLYCRSVLASAYDKAVQALGTNANIVSTLSVLDACCLLETGNGRHARSRLTACLPSLPYHGVSEIAYCGVEAAMELWNGEKDDVFRPSAMMSFLASYARPMNFVAHCFLIRKLLRLGRMEDALHSAELIGMNLEDPDLAPPIPSMCYTAYVRELKGMTHLEFFLSRGMYKQAAALCENLLKEANSRKRRGRMVEFEVIGACIARKLDNTFQSRRHLYRAIRIAGKRQIFGPFLQWLECVQEIMRNSKRKEWTFVEPEERSLYERLGQWEKSAESSSTASQVGSDAREEIRVPLTVRELELLRLVHAGLSNQQIADSTGVALPTVKWHLYNVYAKLDVKNRSAAIARARSLSLIF